MISETDKPVVSEPAEPILPTIEQVLTNERGEPMTWGATPMVLNANTMPQQVEVGAELGKLFDDDKVPEYVPDSVADYARNTIYPARFERRQFRNQRSYTLRKKDDLTGVPVEAVGGIERSLNGYGSPAEILYTQRILGIPTVELGSLTHPYGQRSELLVPMENAVKEAISMYVNGHGTSNGDVSYILKDSDGAYNSTSAIHILRKETIGLIGDDTYIIKRSSFILIVDALPAQYARAIKSRKYDNKQFWPGNIYLHKIGGLDLVLPDILKDPKIALPMSTTIVSINEPLRRELLDDRSVLQEKLIDVTSSVASQAMSAAEVTVKP